MLVPVTIDDELLKKALQASRLRTPEAVLKQVAGCNPILGYVRL